MLKAIAICGHICSGKSSVINFLAEIYKWNIISFGSYIRHLASTQGLASSRGSYQILGQKIFDERGPKRFLHDVIDFNKPTSDIHLFDGIRHLAILDALSQVYGTTLVVYLALDDRERYSRFIQRSLQGDSSLTFDEFVQLSTQPAEQGIFEIAQIADVQIDTSKSLMDIVKAIEEVLVSRKFILSPFVT